MTDDCFTRIPDHQLASRLGSHPIAPQHPHQLAWAYELIEPTSRLYGVDADAVLAAVIEDYPSNGSEADRATARAHHAVATAQALTAARHAAHRQVLPDHQEHTLQLPASVPVTELRWDCPVPLTLVDIVYMPFTSAAAPIGKVQWLHSREADSYLLSLCEAGAVIVHRAGVS